MHFHQKYSCAISIFLSILILNACSSKSGPVTQANFVLNVSSLVTGTPLTGGVKVLAKSTETPPKEDYKTELDSSDVAIIPQGDWNIYLVGYTGPNKWGGIRYCGMTTAKLAQDEETLTLTLNRNECSFEPYLGIIQEGQGKFDQGIFDVANFGD